MKKILFVDDDRFFADAYADALRDRFEVRCIYDAETALEALRVDGSLSAAVVDVMMPPPKGFEVETHDGSSTGIWLLQQAREQIIGRGLPIIVWSNRGLDYIEDEIALIGFPPNLITISSKMAVPDFALPRVVESSIARSQPRRS